MHHSVYCHSCATVILSFWHCALSAHQAHLSPPAQNHLQHLNHRLPISLSCPTSSLSFALDCHSYASVDPSLCHCALSGASPSTNTESSESPPDLSFMSDILSLIRTRRIAAPAPIEQRWSSGSRSYMSPTTGAAHAAAAAAAAASGRAGSWKEIDQALNKVHTVYSWVSGPLSQPDLIVFAVYFLTCCCCCFCFCCFCCYCCCFCCCYCCSCREPEGGSSGTRQ